ncbi:MAG: ABC transporter substrate-binding protein [Thaumarchaeota archaeon]|nr:ABC transporter substrate-binding protein [Nitrososphaerota archaeon]
MRIRSKSVYSIIVLIVLIIGGMTALGATNFKSHAQSSTACTPGTTFRLTFFPAPTNLNFLGSFATSNVRLEDMMWFPLVPASYPDGSPNTNFSVTDWYSHNANYSQWEFNVRPGLMWSDGTAVNASDILATYGPNYGLNASYDVLNLRLQIKQSYALNASTAVYVLNASNPYLPTDFGITDSVVYPRSMIQKDGVSSNFFNNVVVDGPWAASNYTSGESQMLMVRNQYFKPLPAICQIEVSFTEVEGLDAQLVQSGATDLAEVTYATASALLATPNIQVMDEKGPQMQDLQYNVTLYPFNVTAFRQAMVYGINQSAILQTAFNGYGVAGYAAQGTIPPTLALYYNPNQVKYNYSQSIALSLLHSAGFTGGGSLSTPLKYPNGTSVTLTLYTDTSKSFDVTSASVIVSNLNSLGITVNTITVSVGALFGLPNVPAAEMVLFTTGAPDFSNPIYDGTEGWNVYSPVTIPQQYWNYPPSVDAQYKSNFTALEATGNTTLVVHYLNTIQSIDAQYLPSIVTIYPDDLWAYSTANWVNWTPFPQGYINFYLHFNPLELATLQPVAPGTTSTTVASSSTTASSATSSATTPTVTAPPTTSSSTSSPPPSTSGNSTLTIAAIIVVVIIVIAVAAVFLRRRTPSSSPSSSK